MQKSYLIFFCFLTINTFAQDYCIKGRVVNADKKNLDYINVQLLNNDSSQIKGGSFIDGVFIFDKIKKREFIVKICALGYKDYFTNVKINTNDTLNLGMLTMTTTVLNEVVVEGFKPKIKVENGIINVNVQNSNLKDVGNAVDVLSKCPGVVCF